MILAILLTVLVVNAQVAMVDSHWITEIVRPLGTTIVLLMIQILDCVFSAIMALSWIVNQFALKLIHNARFLIILFQSALNVTKDMQLICKEYVHSKQLQPLMFKTVFNTIIKTPVQNVSIFITYQIMFAWQQIPCAKHSTWQMETV